jgi:4-amino-4-deoxy-L-arabinose transferase-like glycosyltransferase
MGLARRQRIWPGVLALSVVGLGLAFSAFYFDLSWDGQWYHQTGIYALAENWNALTDPFRTFTDPPSAELWVRHYPKGPWYVAASVFATTGRVEWGKCIDLISWAAMGLATFAAALDYGLRRSRAAAIAVVVALNPAVISEITTYMVDGVMMSFLAVAAAAVFSGFRRPQPVVIFVGLLAAIASINAKFTGLVFLCFILAGGGVWCIVQARQWLVRYCGLALISIFLGAAVWGFNPYVINTIYRHNPFYPQSGSKEFPSLDDQGKQGIELHETPKNFLPHNRFSRLFLATFGRPGNMPYHRELKSSLMWPFAARWADLFYYRYHETRVAGFGPWFSGALLLSLALAAWVLLKRNSAPLAARAVMILVALTILASLVISPYFWWARYGPQLWLLPIVPAVFVFWAPPSRWALNAAWVLVALLTVNAGIVAAVRLKWETNNSLTMRRQLTQLRQIGMEREILFYIPSFGVSIEGRLNAWGITYKIGDRNQVGTGPRLLTIVEDYPSPVRYRLLPQAATRPAK